MFLLLDLVAISTTALLLTKGIGKKAVFPLVASVAYVAINYTIFLSTSDMSVRDSVLQVAELKNFVYSNKFLCYVTIASFYVGKNAFGNWFFQRAFWSLSLSMAIKYSFDRVFGIDDRPKLLLENNYEVMSMVVFYIVSVIFALRAGRSPSVFAMLLVVLVVVLSGSRSSVLCLIPAGLLHLRKTPLHLLAAFVGSVACFAIIAFVFYSRGASLDDIDRYRFFQLFAYEVQDFNIVNWMFGTKPLTPLTSHTSTSLSYYEGLFSAADDGRCYALVFHSFFMRVVFDHGVVGVFSAFGLFGYCLRVSGYSHKEVLVLLCLPFFSALSVSSFGTAFVSFPLALAIGGRFPQYADRDRLSFDNENVG